ncbi:ABC transporter permease [Cytobacillus praedii]|uniref:ABC transporter permease n=1 Tax=Cytobacillus praedii TaxID=1742358 RepID=A0A4R1AUW6_9BACI|nr:ABC transporter permease [Cytobacillus praedii]TCJ01522.1 ABC transporter permease [Cytobacillus praedii]
MQEISNLALFIILLFVFVPIIISMNQKLGMGKDILYSSIRGFIQLLLLGFFISFLFSLENVFVVFGYIFLMMIIASLNASKRGLDRKKSFFILLAGIALSVLLCICIWLVFEIIPLEAQYLIPVGGMFIGNAMIAGAVVLEAMKNNPEMEEEFLKKKAIKIAMIPTVDMLKTVGLIQIPGTMTGMILAGADPFGSVKYQIFIIFTLLVVSSLAAIIVCLLNYKYIMKEISIQQDTSITL